MVNAKPVIVPAILSASKTELVQKLAAIAGLSDWLQIDITDGLFVSSKTIDLSELNGVKINANLEIHLMTARPVDFFAACQAAGAQRVFFHSECAQTVEEVLAASKNFKFTIGLALKPATPVEEVQTYLNQVGAVLVLSVEPGYQGGEFIPAVLNKIKQLKTLAPGLAVSIDGGINSDNIKITATAGADYLVIGSAIWQNTDIAKSVKRLVDIINS